MTQDQALKILKTGTNVFLTGEPGSGKTYTINQYISYLQSREIYPAITASTGIAATHIGGSTIHSWSGIGIAAFLDKYSLDRITSNKYVMRRVENAKVLVIDEVSMLAPQTLSMVEAVCRQIKHNELAFGGMQVIFVGDFFQLPPILAEKHLVQNIFAYQSEAWGSANPVICYLTEQFRQTDNNFNLLLNAIRTGEFDGEFLSFLESRIITPESKLDGIPKLFSHNADVDRVNTNHLNKLPGSSQTFVMQALGRGNLVEALKRSCLSPEKLELKLNSSVMFTKNNSKEGYVNGTLGTVVGFNEDSGYPIVKTFNDEKITVTPVDWSIVEGERVLAQVSQIPLRLAWAITVHKSQGMTLDAAVMDLRQVFEFGQGYVALSRVRSLSGLHLYGWNERTFEVHPQILAIDQVFRASSAQAELEFGKIASEIKIMHDNFILASGGTLKANENYEYRPLQSKTKTDTYEKTFILWSEGKTIDEIASLRSLTEQTILSHIEKLLKKEKISDTELLRLVSAELSSLLPIIHAAFEELGAEKLSPVFVKFNGKYSYNDIRIARMVFKKIS